MNEEHYSEFQGY